MNIAFSVIDEIVRQALREDEGGGDITTLSAIPAEVEAEARIVAKDPGVIAGLPIAAAVFDMVDPSVDVAFLVEDGDAVKAGDVLMQITGIARSILIGERVALNFLQRMSGIATLTSQYVAKVHDLPVRVLDTRKTTPGLRVLEKYAVRMGGGYNHRHGLYDAVMLKDNHLVILAALGESLAHSIERTKRSIGPFVKVEVEVESVEQARIAAEAGADIILLDNMTEEMLQQSVEVVAGRSLLEASGNVSLDTIRTIAESGVDCISVGALTHSVRSLDISLDLLPER